MNNKDLIQERDNYELKKIFGKTRSVTMRKYLEKISKKEDTFTINEISKDLNLSLNTARSYIYELKNAGFVISCDRGIYQHLNLYTPNSGSYKEGDVILGFHNITLTFDRKIWGVNPLPEILTSTTFFGIKIDHQRTIKFPKECRGKNLSCHIKCSKNPLLVIEFYTLLNNLPENTSINRLELNIDYVGLKKKYIDAITMKLNGNNNNINVYSKRIGSYNVLRVERKFFWKNGEMNPDNLIVREIITLVPNLKMYKNVYNGDKHLRGIK